MSKDVVMGIICCVIVWIVGGLACGYSIGYILRLLRDGILSTTILFLIIIIYGLIKGRFTIADVKKEMKELFSRKGGDK